MNLYGNRLDALVALLIEVVARDGSEIARVGRDRILEWDGSCFGIYDAGKGLSGPYDGLDDLITTEGVQIYAEEWDGHGPAHTGSRSIHAWRGAWAHVCSDFEPSFHTSFRDALCFDPDYWAIESAPDLVIEITGIDEAAVLSEMRRELPGGLDFPLITINGKAIDWRQVQGPDEEAH